ncbi:hypothetical protein SAMN05446037_103711 [Anaerovirgula multivorans]|uniref:Uncharacterized protein n=1 Tax=Anaerovirgula multivorans TaxID=312168 RepID=A0A239JMK9_9FIRM|nr:hypothetical protein SAMN05446037_103711 [Anaerovirgula multivorans]
MEKTNFLNFLFSKNDKIKTIQAIILLIILMLIPVFVRILDIKVSKEVQWLIFFPFTMFTLMAICQHNNEH